MNLKQLLSLVRKACDDYSMIEENDKIAVGISGGKDSLSLLIALKHLQRFYPKKFDIVAITVSLGLEADYSPVQELCDSLGVDYHVIKTDIGKIIFEDRKEKNPCSLCSKMRKGALNEHAKRLGCNKIAYGHNRDDSVETFFMSLFYEGRVSCFSPTSYLDRMDLHLIRPLLYVPESDVISFVNNNKVLVVKSPCPVDGLTKREEIKNFVHEYGKNYTNFDEKIFGAIQRSDIKGWRKN